MNAKVGVILSGCGYLDGAEIQESVFTLYFLDRGGATVRCFAPDEVQAETIEHRSAKLTDERRNVASEAARIARGAIEPIEHASMADLDALVLPGGYGVAKNLSSLATEGARAYVHPHLERLVGEAVEQRKPIAALCIAPAVLALALSKHGQRARLTIGNDPDTASVIAQAGSQHVNCAVDDVVVDESLRIVSTPAYMLGPSPSPVARGIERAIETLLAWLR